MALLKSLALGAVAAIAVPHVLHDAAGFLGETARYGTVMPRSGTFAFPFSVPIFAGVAIFAYIFFRASNA